MNLLSVAPSFVVQVSAMSALVMACHSQCARPGSNRASKMWSCSRASIPVARGGQCAPSRARRVAETACPPSCANRMAASRLYTRASEGALGAVLTSMRSAHATMAMLGEAACVHAWRATTRAHAPTIAMLSDGQAWWSYDEEAIHGCSSQQLLNSATRSSGQRRVSPFVGQLNS